MKTKKPRNDLKQKGITLIALVVTIVVLLILAGVSINALFGNSGIIEKAKETQNKMDKATENDQKQIGELTNWIDNQVNGTTGENASCTTIDGNRDGLHYHNDVVYTGTCGTYTYKEGKIVSTIIFNFNGGKGIQNSTEQKCESIDRTDATKPTIIYANTQPTRDGYTLLGWSLTQTSTTANYTSALDIPRILGENITYYAIWKKTGEEISFSISNISYKAIDGMTWRQWVKSSYNTDGWECDNDNMIQNSTRKLALDSLGLNGIDKKIEANESYKGSPIA